MSTHDIIEYAATVFNERPADMAELAKLVAKELRKRGMLSDHESQLVVTIRFNGKYSAGKLSETRRFYHNMHNPDFDNLTPSECADVIQAEEAKRAAEWAGDE